MTWLKDQNFTPVVKSIWDKPCHAHTALDRIQIKLKRFKQFFKGWGFNRQGEQKAKKKAMHEELLSLEQLEEDGLLSADQIRQKTHLITELLKLNEEEEIYWQQRSHDKQLK